MTRLTGVDLNIRCRLKRWLTSQIAEIWAPALIGALGAYISAVICAPGGPVAGGCAAGGLAIGVFIGLVLQRISPWLYNYYCPQHHGIRVRVNVKWRREFWTGISWFWGYPLGPQCNA